MTALARDGSNYTVDPFPTEGIQLAIIQALTPPAGKAHANDGGFCARQVDQCQAAGLPTDAYLFWQDGLSQTFTERIALLDGKQIRQWWVDLEIMSVGLVDGALTRNVQEALDAADKAPSTLGRKAGVYTAQYWINWFVGVGGDLSIFDGRPMWFANPNGRVDPTDTFYGGNPVAIKQYGSDSATGTDLDVLSDDEAALLGVQPQPKPVPSVDPLEGALAYACDTLGDQLLGIQQELKRVREQFLGPRP